MQGCSHPISMPVFPAFSMMLQFAHALYKATIPLIPLSDRLGAVVEHHANCEHDRAQPHQVALTLNQSVSRPSSPEHNRVLKAGEPNG